MPETATKTITKVTKPRKAATKANTPVAAKKPAKKRTAQPTTFLGRPVEYTDALANEICWRITNGESLVQICKDDHIPHCATIYRWLIRFEVFREMYTRAREDQADTNADEIIAIADEQPVVVEVRDKEGNIIDHKLDSAFIAWQKNRIDARKWTAAKLKPRKYGERMAVEGVDGGAAIKTEDNTATKFFEIIRNMEMTKRAG